MGYTPFGEMWVEEASTVDIDHITRFFTNQQYDKESGLYYYNARYYDPHLGSFITPDPAKANLNHYAYASANPIKYTDPTGLMDEDDASGQPQPPAEGGGGGGDDDVTGGAAGGVEGSNDDDYDPYGDTGYPIEYDYGEMTPGMDEGHPVEYDYGEFTPGMDPGYDARTDYVNPDNPALAAACNAWNAVVSEGKISAGGKGSGKSSGSGIAEAGKASSKDNKKSSGKNEKEIDAVSKALLEIDFDYKLKNGQYKFSDYLNKNGKDKNESKNIWRGLQYDLSDVDRHLNKFCFFGELLKDCLNRMNIDITKNRAKSIADSMYGKGFIDKYGNFLKKSGTIQNAIWN